MAAHPRRIVVGYDGSGTSQRALVAAADLAGYGSTLTVVSVQPADAPSGGKAIDQAREHLLRRQVSALYLDRFGEPADEIGARHVRSMRTWLSWATPYEHCEVSNSGRSAPRFSAGRTATCSLSASAPVSG